MSRSVQFLHPLLQLADGPVLTEGLNDPALSVAPTLETERRSERDFTDALASGEDLSAQRWGLIVPMGSTGDRLLESISPLIEERARQQDSKKEEVVVLRVPPGSDLSIQAARTWREQYYDTIATWDRPTYLLILGNLHEVAESIHHVLSERLVGRLAFSQPSGEPDFVAYRQYAEKVLRWESTPSPETEARARILVVRDGTPATEMAMDALVKPLLSLVDRAGARFPVSDINPEEQAWLINGDGLVTQGSRRPATVLFTASHGYGGPRGGWGAGQSEEQRQAQGALCFALRGARLYGRDIAAMESFLPGGIWFMLACYGAGTPHSSHYRHWLERLAKSNEFAGSAASVLRALPSASERPFIAAVPQAALAHPEGPLACIGHLDLAWSYSFQDFDTGRARSRPDAFFGVLRTLARRGRVGMAYLQLLQAQHMANNYLSYLYDTAEETNTPPPAAQLGHLWMLRQDLAGYILLGDPAARLPLRPSSRAI